MKLKPCPFCGGEADIVEMKGIINSYYIRWLIYCDNGCVDMPPAEDKDEAIKNWNTRTKEN